MKKLILAFTIATSAIASFGQTYYVTNKILPDTLDSYSKELVNIIKGEVARTNRVLTNYKFRQNEKYDTIYNETLVDLYLAQDMNLYNSLLNQFTVIDTIPVIKIDNGFYLNNDSLGLSISEQKLVIKSRYDKIVAI